MEWTLNLPDDLAARISGRDDLLLRALELGLEALESEEELGPDSDLSDVWQRALAGLMDQRQQASGSPPPTPEELIAYHRDELDPAARESFRDRLALHPEAVRDLSDLIAFGRDQPSGPTERRETTEALREFRSRVAAREPAASSVRRAALVRHRRWLTLAAVLLGLVGASWLAWTLGLRGVATGLRHATVIDIAASRGARAFSVSQSAREILLILPLEATMTAKRGTVRITSVGGEMIYEGSFEGGADARGRIYLALPSDSLQAGTYHLESETPGSEGRPEIREYRFAISDRHGD